MSRKPKGIPRLHDDIVHLESARTKFLRDLPLDDDERRCVATVLNRLLENGNGSAPDTLICEGARAKVQGNLPLDEHERERAATALGQILDSGNRELKNRSLGHSKRGNPVDADLLKKQGREVVAAVIELCCRQGCNLAAAYRQLGGIALFTDPHAEFRGALTRKAPLAAKQIEKIFLRRTTQADRDTLKHAAKMIPPSRGN